MLKPENIKFIVIHCTATKDDPKIGVEQIRRDHVENNGWTDIGYHYLVKTDGTIQLGRDDKTEGAHVKGYNSMSVGIAYVGGETAEGECTLFRNCNQESSLYILVRMLQHRYPNARVVGHRDLSPDKNGNGTIEENEWLKLCPCFDVGQWLRRKQENERPPLSIENN